VSAQEERFGVLVLRAWLEDDAFRARITTTFELEGEPEIQVVASPAAALEAVSRWLDRLGP
jgi:hypothetical protein